ncbi:MAG: hypothetical protein HBSAPP03_20910 [Phycisphaerae bacterium]|nr:MAG: hypothetical protein HBSAPP03_20910 [Phycisphaerae bacterium]
MFNRALIAAVAACGIGSTAYAGIAMSFADPVPGRQWHNEANGGGAGIGFMTYDSTASLSFLFDGSEDSLPNHTFVNAVMQLEMTIGAATTLGGVTTAPVSGFFKIYDGSIAPENIIIIGIADAGTYVRISNTNSILFSDPSFSYVAGPALEAITGPIVFTDPSEAVFTLTSVVAAGGGSFLNPDGTFKTFDANASFSGNTQAVPAPGALALVGLGTLVMAKRRRG